MKGYCRVCPTCNGVACAGQVPGMGGAGTGASFQENIKSLAGYKLNMRVLHSVKEPDTTVHFLGKKLDFPLLAAPIGGISFNMGGKVSEQYYIDSVIKGCVEKGILGCIGDGVPDFIHLSGFEALKKVAGEGIPFIKPWEDKELFDKLAKAEAAGCSTVGIDIDAAGLITLRKMGRPVGPRSPDNWLKLKQRIEMKLILKGIMTIDEAQMAVDIGADAIVVSNHGGRVLDQTPGVATVLPAIADAVKGKISILADGGIRSGGDILKMLALGADAVMIGRPFAVAAIGGLDVGVSSYLESIKQELLQSMVLTGCSCVTDVPKNVLFGHHSGN